MLSFRHLIISATVITGACVFAASAHRNASADAPTNIELSSSTEDDFPSNLSDYTPQEQLTLLADRYVGASDERSTKVKQSKLIRASVRRHAKKNNVPEIIALGISGHESGGWKMWKQTPEYKSLENINYNSRGQRASSDWGVMQINDEAHTQAFPRAKHDVEYNIAFGIELLATTHKYIHGNLNMGFGDWDKTIAAYHLGHAPKPSEMRHTRKYIQRIQQILKEENLLKNLSYTVRPGDTLNKIAAIHYKNPNAWYPIWKKNRGTLPKPTALRAGQRLNIPF